jgi:phospholipid transport system substrate-binding protein
VIQSIREFFADVNRVLADQSYEDRLPERLAALRALVVEVVDFRDAAAVALGPEWSSRTPGEREEFVRLFADLLQTSVFSSIGGRARIENGLTVTYIGELDDREGVTVATTVLARNGREMAVGYRMAQRDGRWMIHDVVVDGVSLVDNYRAQFQKVMQRSSYEDLVGEMRARIADLGHAPVTASMRPVPAIVTAAPAVSAPSLAEPPVQQPAPVMTITPAPVVVAVAPAVSAPVQTAVAPVQTAVAPVQTTVSAPVQTVVARVPAVGAPPRISAIAEIPPRAVAPPSTDARGFWIQVGAFRSDERAMQVLAALRDQTASLLAAPAQLLRVVVGPFSDRRAAAAKLREIRARGYDAFIAEAPK